MIVLKTFLCIIWGIVSFVYFIICGLHIEKIKSIRIIILTLLGTGIILSYFIFTKLILLILSIIGIFLYLRWEYQEARRKILKFNSNRLVKSLFSWIFIKAEEDVLINLVFPKILTYFIIMVLSISRRVRPFIKGIIGTEIEVETKEAIISIYI